MLPQPLAQTAQNKRATDNAIVAMATLTRVKVAASRDFFMKSLLHFCKFLVNPNFNVETNYIFRKPTNRCFQ